MSVSLRSEHFTNGSILNSSRSYHMSPYRNSFDTYKTVNSKSILMGKDRSCKVVEIGNIMIKMFDVVVIIGWREAPAKSKAEFGLARHLRL
jgi:hypothetical protein